MGPLPVLYISHLLLRVPTCSSVSPVSKEPHLNLRPFTCPSQLPLSGLCEKAGIFHSQSAGQQADVPEESYYASPKC